MANVTLYHSWLCPRSRMVRMALVEKRLEVALRLEKDWERRPDFLKLNPAGQVPVLIDGDGRPLADARAICVWLEDIVTEPALWPDTPADRHEVNRLVGWFCDKFDAEVTSHLVSEKLMKRFLRMGEPSSEAIRCGLFNLKNHLEYLVFLTGRRHYLAGERFTMADVAACAHISIVDYFGDVDWADWPSVKDWYVRVKSRRSVRQVLSDRIPGLTPPRHYDKLDF